MLPISDLLQHMNAPHQSSVRLFINGRLTLYSGRVCHDFCWHLPSLTALDTALRRRLPANFPLPLADFLGFSTASASSTALASTHLHAMSVRLPARRLLQPAVSLSHQPRRNAWSFGNLFRSKSKKDSEAKSIQGSSNPILDDYLKKKHSKQPGGQEQPGPKGDLAPTSIFDDGSKQPKERSKEEQERRAAKKERNRQAMAMALDPKPEQRMRWERKMVIREVRKRGRLTRAQQIKRTEREDLVKSPWIKTSVKKLNMLARQIAGKSLDEALLQMRFSKKKAAQDILQHLEYARDHAVVSRGMGLGKVEGTSGSPTPIRLKDGKKKLVTDKTNLYVDQAWVGRGEYGKAYDYRARGRVNVMRLPSTSISIKLKEEATRIREYKEREEKKANRKVWVHLPDRVIPTQRQHVMW
ncbi:hypothetical protein IWX90DRAFT_424663 [Phyllosticta citrichinensis]|uniref:Ribosomal protein L22 n=1 Tax=Phyllosticta citrichinensis TaxID=1130410 RepID=A0ABR1Y3S2_9PEZI